MRKLIFWASIGIIGVIVNQQKSVSMEKLIQNTSSILIKKKIVSQESLGKILLAAGTIESVSKVEKAHKPSYCMVANFGEYGTRTSVGQFPQNYSINEMMGKQIFGILNFKPRKIAGIQSEYLTVGFYDKNHGALCLNTFGQVLPNGSVIKPEIEKEKIIEFDSFLENEIVVGRVIKIKEEDNETEIDIKFDTERGVATVKTGSLKTNKIIGKLVPVFINGDKKLEILGFQVFEKFLPLGVDEKDVEVPLGGYLG